MGWVECFVLGSAAERKSGMKTSTPARRTGIVPMLVRMSDDLLQEFTINFHRSSLPPSHTDKLSCNNCEIRKNAL